ncbi:Sec-independent protein translocase TatC [Thermoplasma sp.]|uniref:Sec-independent protein translocase TatC n=1 Tax=Thermoplasma sp. TaxID=1973142 RepID=UPI00127665FF|nr:Sec-independent protein translocase TatC [Thermoplasma sp.]KAA8922871.1 MAG: Sec-independent protein translocase TatC [Thermoplasma sp.]
MPSELLDLLQKNIEELRLRAVRALIGFFVFFFIFFTFRFQYAIILGHRVIIPYPDPYDNAGAQFLKISEYHVLPKNVELIALKPTDAMVADIYSVMFLALLFSMPIIVMEAAKFIAPGLKKKELQAIRSLGIPAAALFAIGSLFGFWYVFPLLFRIFFYFDFAVGSSPTMGIANYTSFFFIYIASFGLSFEMPVIMVGLTKLRLVPAGFWLKNWRYAVVGSLIFGLVFSPGVLGVSMMIMAVPMMALYVIGALIAKRVEKKDQALYNVATD